jgi:hypothetical protein
MEYFENRKGKRQKSRMFVFLRTFCFCDPVKFFLFGLLNLGIGIFERGNG